MYMDVDPVYVQRQRQQVIGDVVDTYSPCIDMNVHFGSIHITNGCTLKPSEAANAPKIDFDSQPGHLYTLLMIDPDMPSASNPTMREWVHWIVTDIPGSGITGHGNEVLPYMPLNPARGVHRYIILLYNQATPPLRIIEPPVTRANFNSKAFAHRYELGVPKAVVYFVAKKEKDPLKKRQKVD